MSLAAEREMIETHLSTNWLARTKIQWEDIPCEPDDTEAWLACFIINGQEQNRSVGSPGTNLVRGVGVFAIQVHIPSGQGSAPFRVLADDLMALYRNKVLGNIRFMPPYVSGGSTKVGNFTSRTIMCPFTRDEFNG